MHADVVVWSAMVCPACVILTLNVAAYMEYEYTSASSYLEHVTQYLCNMNYGITLPFHLITVDNAQGHSKLIVK